MKRGLLVFVTITLCVIIGPSHQAMARTHGIGQDGGCKGTHGNLDRLIPFNISDRAFVDPSSTNFSVPGW